MLTARIAKRKAFIPVEASPSIPIPPGTAIARLAGMKDIQHVIDALLAKRPAGFRNKHLAEALGVSNFWSSISKVCTPSLKRLLTSCFSRCRVCSSSQLTWSLRLPGPSPMLSASATDAAGGRLRSRSSCRRGPGPRRHSRLTSKRERLRQPIKTSVARY